MLGKILNHYEIGEQLGAGGMGAVYRAKDRKLGRDVAIKVLPEEFAKDADRIARFQREAKLLASLNHPNIAAIHGLEESGGINFLVLELVEGQTLADRIKTGPVSVEESLKLALQIAEALEAAHEKGVIHRDLKPANIKVTPDGKVKVLDFGLAKALAGEQAEPNLSNSPTLSNAATQQGVILGTAAYMSPEQARGKPVDKRTDIWAFGCVLYEMLTGKAAFQGEDITEIIAAVVKSEVNLGLLPANVHPRMREVLIRCLQKEQKKRYRDIGEAQYEIEQVLTDSSGVFVPAIADMERRTNLRTILPWIAAAVVITAIIAGLFVWNLRKPEPRQVMRFEYELPEGQQFIVNRFSSIPLAASPDGKQFVYNTAKGLYLRSVDTLDARLIAGTQLAINPFFSPDGKWIGYWSAADGHLKKIAIAGGAPVPLIRTPNTLRSIWGADNKIVYFKLGTGIMRISADGGTPEVLVKAEKEMTIHPQILPNGTSVLYTALAISTGQSKIKIQSLKSGECKELFSGSAALYLPTGHIVYRLENNLYSVPFDIDKLEVEGEPVTRIKGVFQPFSPSPHFAISDSGTLLYVPGIASAPSANRRTLVWVDRNGKEEPIAAAPDEYSQPRISPDGLRVALTVGNPNTTDIFIWDVVRQNLARLTFDAAPDSFPLWSPDGKMIVFFSMREKQGGIYMKAADGAGKEELVSSKNMGVWPHAWSPDGKTLVLQEYEPGLGIYIGMLSMDGDRKRRALLKEKYQEALPQLSRDGRYIAYSSGERGKREIYVRPFPDVDKGQWQISTGGGDSPLWSPDGRELFYRNGDAVVSVPVETQPAFKPGKPRTIFRGGDYVSTSLYDGNQWDISPDGKRFLMLKKVASGNKPDAAEAPRKINIVLNWVEELKQRAPAQ